MIVFYNFFFDNCYYLPINHHALTSNRQGAKKGSGKVAPFTLFTLFTPLHNHRQSGPGPTQGLGGTNRILLRFGCWNRLILTASTAVPVPNGTSTSMTPSRSILNWRNTATVTVTVIVALLGTVTVRRSFLPPRSLSKSASSCWCLGCATQPRAWSTSTV